MKLFRYEYVGPDSLDRFNRILRRGWQPVREVTRSGETQGTADVLVLLEKEAEFSTFSGDEILSGLPVDFLKGVMLFEDMTDDEIRQLVNQCEVQSFAAGHQLFTQGAPADSMCIVLQGAVDVMLPELPVQGQAVVSLEQGGVFGESSFFSESPHSMSATVGDAGATLLTLDRVAFDEMFQVGLPIALKLTNNAARILAARLQETDAWVWDLLSQSQHAQISSSWRRFRHRVSSNETQGGFFGI
jgi:CRP/FNR family cyclic AMP-dependent transcriptional regulator